MPSFTSWNKLDDDDKKHRQQIEIAIEKQNIEGALSLMTNCNFETLILLTENSNIIDTLAADEKFKSYWLDHLDAISNRNLNFKASNYTDLSAYQLVKGIFFYQLALEARHKNKIDYSNDETSFLIQSLKYHCFHAALELVLHATQNLNDMQQGQLALSIAENAAQHHQAPGYILLFETYYLYAKHYQDELFFQKALFALEVAKQLCESEIANDAIMNVSFGKGLPALNICNFKSWQHASSEVITQGKLLPTQVNKAMDEANARINGLRR